MAHPCPAGGAAPVLSYDLGQLNLSWDNPQRTYTVSDFTDRVTQLLLNEFPDVWISGEISGVRQAASGHWYFTLKDENAQLKCACFKMSALRLRVKPTEGMAVLARGRVEVYAARGEYQLIVDALEPRGLGALQAAFEALKKKLAREGLFDPARRRPLPDYPQRIGIVTSPTGAAIQDLINILSRRAPGVAIRLYPALVQGEGSTEQVCRGIDYFADSGWAEVIIVGRGGGSLEDLWTFNEEAVARAIAASPVPVVSAVGHETDFTIADFVADLRAPTPSAAAEIVTQQWAALPERLRRDTIRLERGMGQVLTRAGERLNRQAVGRARLMIQLRLNRLEQRMDDLDSRLRRGDLRLRLQNARARLEQFENRSAVVIKSELTDAFSRLEAARTQAIMAMRELMAGQRPRLDQLSAGLTQMNPLRVLDRGYAIVQGPGGVALKTVPPAGTALQVRVAGGEFTAHSD
jgi:exodeoxyribonuclease VII large subunit